MPHHPKPFFKKSRDSWYVEINRKQIKLGSDKAFQLYHQLMAQPREQSVSPEMLVGIIDVFLDWVHKNRAPDSYEWYRYRLQRLSEKFPDMRAISLRPYHVEQWVSDSGELAVTTRRNYLRSIKRCMSWAVRQGYLERNPIEALDVPGGERREVYVPPDEFARLLDFTNDPGFRDLLRVTYLSGCRPQESLIVKFEHVDIKHSRWIFPQSQAKGKKAPRIVYLTEPAMDIVKDVMRSTGSRDSDGSQRSVDAGPCLPTPVAQP